MLNRRTYRRARVQRQVEIEPLKTARKSRWIFGAPKSIESASGKLIDIGCGGMCAEVPLSVDVGTACDVRIADNGGRPQRTRGTVRSVRGTNGNRVLGIAFTEPLVVLGDTTRPGPDLRTAGTEPLVVVVDDEPSIRDVLARFLRSRGMRVETTEGAEDALAVLRAEEPALLLVDLKMPEMGGVALLEAMSAEGLRARNIWAMSAYVSDEEALAALALGAAEFINKPFDLDHLDFSLQLLAPTL